MRASREHRSRHIEDRITRTVVEQNDLLRLAVVAPELHEAEVKCVGELPCALSARDHLRGSRACRLHETRTADTRAIATDLGGITRAHDRSLYVGHFPVWMGLARERGDAGDVRGSHRRTG